LENLRGLNVKIQDSSDFWDDLNYFL
jgi:hypothetical protein